MISKNHFKALVKCMHWSLMHACVFRIYICLWLKFVSLSATYIMLHGIYENSYRSVNQWVEYSHTTAALNCKCCPVWSKQWSWTRKLLLSHWYNMRLWLIAMTKYSPVNTLVLSSLNQTNVSMLEQCWNCLVIHVGCGLTRPWYAGANIDMLISYFSFADSKQK